MNNTFSFHNLLKVECPIFKLKVDIKTCLLLHEKNMRGEQVEVRRGCQALMRCGSCPISHVKADLIRNDHERYFSATPKERAFDDAIIHKTARTLVPLTLLDALGVSEQERLRIRETCNVYHKNTILHADHPIRSTLTDLDAYHPKPRKSKTPSTATPTIPVLTPTGMADVVNTMMEELK